MKRRKGAMALSRAPSSPLLLPVLLLTFLAGRGAGSSSHSLRYFVTSVSEPGQKVPQFFVVGYVDDQQFVSYDNITRRCLPKVPWITKVDKINPHYWEMNSQAMWNDEHNFRVYLGTLAGYYNQSGGAHTLQYMYGCELSKDGTKEGHLQFAYDGEDYISLDKKTLTWTAAQVPAERSKRKLDANLANNKYQKTYLEEECIEWLRRYLNYGKEILLRTEVPDVKVTRKADYDGNETLICHAGGFYPKEIDIFWKKDGEFWPQDTYSGLVSPNSDGTYYTFRSITVDSKERERYKCHIEHDGLPNPVDVAWEEPASKLWLIIGCVLAVLLLITAVAGIAAYFKKRQDGYKKAAASDQGSNSSGTGTAVPI